MTGPGCVLALQLWDGAGWLGQALFTWRSLEQWWLSERKGRSVLPRRFWRLSLGGALCLLAYQLHRGDLIFLCGTVLTTSIYARNLWLAGRRPGRAVPPGLAPLWVGLLGFLVLALLPQLRPGGAVDPSAPLAWWLVGGAGQALWSGRFVLQWVASERRGRSHLPAGYFWASLIGGGLLLAYAVHRLDWVMITAYAITPIPYARNLVLMARRSARVATRGPRAQVSRTPRD